MNSKTLNMQKLYNYGKRLEKIWHCQLKNNSSNLDKLISSHITSLIYHYVRSVC